MLLVDTTVLIDAFKGVQNDKVKLFKNAIQKKYCIWNI